MYKGATIVISKNGLGIPVTVVEKLGVYATIATNGLGIPVTIVPSGGTPMIIDGAEEWRPEKLDPDAWFDPSDTSTVFVDRTGTVPATAGSPVGQIKDKSGNNHHAVAPTDAARPTLARMPKTGRRNFLLFSQDFTNSVWVKLNQGSGTAPVLTSGQLAPDGTYTATRLQLNAGANGASDYSLLRQSFGTPAAGPRSLWIKSNTGSNQTVAFVATSAQTKVIATPTWQRLSDAAPASGAAQFDISVGGAASTPATADVVIWAAQRELTSVTPYQKVTNSFDVTEAGVPDVWYLQGDGIDDALNATMPAGQYTGAFCNANGTVTFEEDISISGQENILRVNQLVGVIYVRRNLTTIEKQLLTQYWKAKSYE